MENRIGANFRGPVKIRRTVQLERRTVGRSFILNLVSWFPLHTVELLQNLLNISFKPTRQQQFMREREPRRRGNRSMSVNTLLSDFLRLDENAMIASMYLAKPTLWFVTIATSFPRPAKLSIISNLLSREEVVLHKR